MESSIENSSQENSSQQSTAEVSVVERISQEIARPTIITVLCGYFFVVWIMQIIRAGFVLITLWRSSPDMLNSIEWLRLLGVSSKYELAYIILSLIGLIGLWLMRKWGTYIYTLATVAFLVYVVASTPERSLDFVLSMVYVFLVPAVVVYFSIRYLRAMR